MHIKTKTFNTISVIFGLFLVIAVAHNMATNPRWAGDNGPGVGKLPRQIVKAFLEHTYDKGKADEAMKLYMTPKTVNLVKDTYAHNDGTPTPRIVRRVAGDGLNVIVWQCFDDAVNGQSVEVVDFFRTTNGRVVEWLRPVEQPLKSGRCAQASWPAPAK